MITNECIVEVRKARGEYVKRLNKDGTPQAKVYMVGNYYPADGWELTDAEDISRAIYVRGSTKVFAGFTY